MCAFVYYAYMCVQCLCVHTCDVKMHVYIVCFSVLCIKLVTNENYFTLDINLILNGKEGRKEMFYLTTHSTHFYLRLYGIRHMVKDHSDSEEGNPLPPHRLLFPISSKGCFICTIAQTGQHIPQPLLHQSWSTGWNEKQLNGSTP